MRKWEGRKERSGVGRERGITSRAVMALLASGTAFERLRELSLSLSALVALEVTGGRLCCCGVSVGVAGSGVAVCHGRWFRVVGLFCYIYYVQGSECRAARDYQEFG